MHRQLPNTLEFHRPKIAQMTISAFMGQILAQFKDTVEIGVFNPNDPLKLHYSMKGTTTHQEVQEMLDQETKLFMEFVATQYIKYVRRRGLLISKQRFLVIGA